MEKTERGSKVKFRKLEREAKIERRKKKEEIWKRREIGEKKDK